MTNAQQLARLLALSKADRRRFAALPAAQKRTVATRHLKRIGLLPAKATRATTAAD